MSGTTEINTEIEMLVVVANCIDKLNAAIPGICESCWEYPKYSIRYSDGRTEVGFGGVVVFDSQFSQLAEEDTQEDAEKQIMDEILDNTREKVTIPILHLVGVQSDDIDELATTVFEDGVPDLVYENDDYDIDDVVIVGDDEEEEEHEAAVALGNA